MTGEPSFFDFKTNAYGSVKEKHCRCIIKLGAPGSITGFDVDTSNFNGAPAAFNLNRRTSAERNLGNEAPEVSVKALWAADSETDPLPNDERV
jgi:allantoicase